MSMTLSRPTSATMPARWRWTAKEGCTPSRRKKRPRGRGGTAPAWFNAANEVAVEAFLAGRIGFLEIAAVVEAVLQRCDCQAADSLDDVLEVDAEARRRAAELVAGTVPPRSGMA